MLLFQGECELLAKVQKLLSLSEKNILLNKRSEIQVHGDVEKIKQEPREKDFALPEAKRIKVEDTDKKQTCSFQEVWATCTGTKMKLFQDKVLIEGNSQLNDKHINFVQAMFRNQFAQCCGLQNTLLQHRHKYSVSTKMIQILHIHDNHWVVISNLHCLDNEIRYYDTIYSDIDQQTHDFLNSMFDEDITVTVDTQMQKQEGDRDCGIFFIAVTNSLLHNQIPGPFTQSLLRPHLIHCIENKQMIPFP